MNIYRAIIIAQDELSPNARQHETRGVLEQRTFDKLTEKLKQRLDIRPLKIESTELLFLSEEYRALLYNCYIVLQHEKEKSISEIVDSFSKS